MEVGKTMDYDVTKQANDALNSYFFSLAWLQRPADSFHTFEHKPKMHQIILCLIT